ncbi:cullin-3 [Rhipicephalus sanguineus]|uniref:cullin-3 n=1 Tax=Rhipicephalus sanguineus TaxID=34632 RepID=UPI0018953E1A|nr:cullin-3 [Rhipicephalus sanguineus]
MVARNEGERLYRGLREAVTEHLTNKVARCADKRDRLREAMLGLVKTEREGESVDRASLKKACEMLIVLGLDSRSVYEEDFEVPFLAESAQFYAFLGQQYINTKDAFEYIALVEQHINEESERSKQCLDDSTVVPVVQVVQKELIGKHMKTIVDMEDSGVQHILNSSMTEDLTRLFRFFKCVQGGVKTLLDCVSKHLRNLGRSIVNEHGDSVSLIPEMMDLRDRFDYFIQHSFDDDEDAKKAIATDLQYLLGLTKKSPEHLASGQGASSACAPSASSHGTAPLASPEPALFPRNAGQLKNLPATHSSLNCEPPSLNANANSRSAQEKDGVTGSDADVNAAAVSPTTSRLIVHRHRTP